MWCDQIIGFLKRNSTVPAAVVVFACAYLIILAVNAGPTGAAWVQAIGSVGAIVGAIWISESGHRRDRQMADSAAHIELCRILGLAERGVYEARVAVGMLSEGVERLAGLAADRVDVGRVGQAADLLKSVLQESLPQLVAADVFAVLAHLAEVRAEVSSWRVISLPDDWRNYINAQERAIDIRYSAVARVFEMHNDGTGFLLRTLDK